ncbi:MAG: Gfo/Idh/MocA family oxidoreductase [Candidatus Latescibacteria bacterium]|nr:Gfo/Idh/MocA family oxidoreductase [Candidatus Latescibacterota bacterium]
MDIQSRRAFIGSALAAGAFIAGCSKAKPKVSSIVPVLHEKAPDGPVLKAGLVGCGGRGSGAAQDFIDASPNCEIIALGDVFQDRVDSARQKIEEEKGQTVPKENCFVGFDAYQKVIDSGIDVMIHATPPHFRPQHFAAAVAAGKHVFIEKPMAVDPVGVKSIIETAGQAKTKGLTVISGTCYRHHKKVIETYRLVAEGAIGDILAARAYFNTSQLWYKKREEGWSDMEWMIRDWVNWCWLSGDHIVEQHVHNLDTMSLYIGANPVKAVGFGGRHRRVTGNQYDFFSVDFEYENGLHLSSMCRQIDGCANNVSDFIVGSKGSTDCRGTIWNPDGSIAWKFDDAFREKQPRSKENEADGDTSGQVEVRSMYKQEHIDLVTSIRTSEGRNEAVATAHSTLMGIMGRTAAYTGKEVTWQEMLDSVERLGPELYAMGTAKLDMTLPVPGVSKAT